MRQVVREKRVMIDEKHIHINSVRKKKAASYFIVPGGWYLYAGPLRL